MKILPAPLLVKLANEISQKQMEPSIKTFAMLVEEYLRLYGYAEHIVQCRRQRGHPAKLFGAVDLLEREMV